MPIMQWLYFDALECLAEEEGFSLTEEECAPVGVQSMFKMQVLNVVAVNDGAKFVTSFSPRKTADMMDRSQCLAPKCRTCLPNSVTSW